VLGAREIRAVLREYNIRPAKRLGQNFLIDQNIEKKILNALLIDREDTILEIGPGLGALTEGLCRRAKKVIAIEKDKRLHCFLLRNNTFSNLELIRGDILKYDFINKGSRIKVVGNLPYYISSPILTCLLRQRGLIRTIFITVQKEFAERLIASPGSKAYGSISCFTQFYTEPTLLFTIKKTVFYPAPKVDSCFLKISVREAGLYLTDEEKLFKIIRTCFRKRRKQILNSLHSSLEFGSREEIVDSLEQAGIAPARRPETVSLQEFVDLANNIG